MSARLTLVWRIYQPNPSEPLELMGVAAGDFPPSRVPVLQMTQFSSKDCTLDCIHSAVPADEFMLVFSVSPVISRLSHPTRQPRIGSDKRSGVATCPQVFSRIKAKASYVA